MLMSNPVNPFNYMSKNKSGQDRANQNMQPRIAFIER